MEFAGHAGMRAHCLALSLLVLGCAGQATSAVRLRRVVLYQSGLAYCERAGVASGDGVRIELAAHEVDDMLTTLTVLDRGAGGAAPAVALSPSRPRARESQAVVVATGPGPVTLAYSAPTSAWRASYRLVLPEGRGETSAWLQVWAVVDNTSAERWQDVELTLATDEPLSFAVDLRTPRVVERANLAGYRSPPIAFAPVRSGRSTRSSAGDSDRDGVVDSVDRCPDDPEDTDAFEDEDGCPDDDNDHDGIPDVDDLAPNQPETFNGVDDEDGAPDSGSVVVTESSLRILDRVFFQEGRALLTEDDEPLLAAIARTLAEHPEVEGLEIQGHADQAEAGAWRLGAQRAAVVQAWLVQHGVSAARLMVRTYGATQPLTPESDERNRRVGFLIVRTASPEPAGEGAAVAVAPERLARSASHGALPTVGAGGTRFPVARGVSIAPGESAMVTVLDRAIEGEDILLYRVDAEVPGSADHPYRAARLLNGSGVDLIAGPIALFSGGEFAGQSLLTPLRVGENAFVPYALDSSTQVAVTHDRRYEPSRVLGFSGGRVRLERRVISRTTYRVEAGQGAAARMFIRHERRAGTQPLELPPDTETSPDALWIPIPLAAGQDSEIAVEEQGTQERSLSLLSARAIDLAPYLSGSDLPPEVTERLTDLVRARETFMAVRARAALLEPQLGETASRSAELRRNLESLDERAGRSVRAARRRMAARLEEAERRVDELASQLGDLRSEELEAATRLRSLMRGFRF